MKIALLSTTLQNKNKSGKFRLLKPIKKEQITGILGYFFLLLFIYAALRKLVDLETFVKEIWGFELFGTKFMIKWEFLILSSCELIVSLSLAIPRMQLFGWYGTFFLLITINISTFYMQQYAKVIPLYYGGILPSVSFITHFTFNIIVLFLALFGMLSYTDLKKSKIPV